MQAIRINSCKSFRIDLLITTLIAVTSTLFVIFGPAESRRVNIMVAVVAFVCLLGLALKASYIIDGNQIARHAWNSGRLKLNQRPWSTVREIVVLDDGGQTMTTLLFNFEQGKAWEIDVKRAADQEAILEHAKTLGIRITQKTI